MSSPLSKEFILSADRGTLAEKRKELGLSPGKHCSCNWGLDCMRYQMIFTQQGDKLRGGNNIAICGINTSTKPKNRKWRQVLEHYVLGPIPENEEKERYPIARHHWSKEQLQYMTDNHVLISSSVPREVAKQTAHSFDVTAKWTNPKGEEEYFHVPNMSKKAVEQEALSFFDPRNIRRQEREEKIQQQKELEEKQAFEKLTFDQYKQQQQVQQALVASLQAQIQTLTSERDECLEKLKSVRKENQNLRRSNRDYKERNKKRKQSRTSDGSNEPFDMAQWNRPTAEQVRHAAAVAAASAAQAVRKLEAQRQQQQQQAQQQQQQVQQQHHHHHQQQQQQQGMNANASF